MKPWPALLAWWLDELEEEEAHEIEAHLFECDDCGSRLRELLRLGAAVRRALLEGHVAGAVSARFIDRLREDGLNIREYHLEAGGSVACTVAPDDDLRHPLQHVVADVLVELGRSSHCSDCHRDRLARRPPVGGVRLSARRAAGFPGPPGKPDLLG